MTAYASHFSRNFPRKLTHIFTIRDVQHCAAISATAELLLQMWCVLSTTV